MALSYRLKFEIEYYSNSKYVAFILIVYEEPDAFHKLKLPTERKASTKLFSSKSKQFTFNDDKILFNNLILIFLKLYDFTFETFSFLSSS